MVLCQLRGILAEILFSVNNRGGKTEGAREKGKETKEGKERTHKVTLCVEREKLIDIEKHMNFQTHHRDSAVRNEEKQKSINTVVLDLDLDLRVEIWESFVVFSRSFALKHKQIILRA